MGGSVAVAKRKPDIMSIFVDDKLLKGELIMKRSRCARQGFVEYVKCGSWAEDLIKYEDYLLCRHQSDSSVWVKYGYKSPTAPSPSRKFISKANSFLSDRSSDYGETESSTEFAYQKMVLEELYSTISCSDLFKTEDLRSVLLAALLPIYLQSREYIQSKCSSEWIERADTATTIAENAALESPEPEEKEDQELSNRKRSERLQDWLLGAAAMSDSSQLEEYLADPYSSWVEDYKKILKNLPVTVYVCLVDAKKQESRVVFSSTSKKLGANLHDLFSARCSAHEAVKVRRAVFGGKPLKLCLMTDACTLRALKPVHDAEGCLKYMIGVVSQSFSNHPLGGGAGLSEQPFQQVEDLLTVLPLLIKSDSLRQQ